MLPKTSLGLALALAAPVLSAQTLDEIIAKNVKAKGGLDKIKAVQTARLTGKMVVGPGMEAPFVMELKRPRHLRMEITFQGMTGTQAYDGKSGWAVMPFQGRKDPESMSADDLKLVDEQADFDGPLVDYKEKGHTVDLLGKEKVEGSDAFKIKVTLKNGDVRHLYLDAESFLEIKAEAKRTIRGSEQEFESIIGDYKEVGGLMLPHSMEGGPKGGTMRQKLTIDKIELNVPIEDARFKMPEVKKAEPSPSPSPSPKK